MDGHLGRLIKFDDLRKNDFQTDRNRNVNHG